MRMALVSRELRAGISSTWSNSAVRISPIRRPEAPASRRSLPLMARSARVSGSPRCRTLRIIGAQCASDPLRSAHRARRSSAAGPTRASQRRTAGSSNPSGDGGSSEQAFARFTSALDALNRRSTWSGVAVRSAVRRTGSRCSSGSAAARARTSGVVRSSSGIQYVVAPTARQKETNAATERAVRSPLNHSSRTRSAERLARPGAEATAAAQVAGSMVKANRAANRMPRRIRR